MRGQAFITYKNIESAMLAIHNMNGKKIFGK